MRQDHDVVRLMISIKEVDIGDTDLRTFAIFHTYLHFKRFKLQALLMGNRSMIYSRAKYSPELAERKVLYEPNGTMRIGQASSITTESSNIAYFVYAMYPLLRYELAISHWVSLPSESNFS